MKVFYDFFPALVFFIAFKLYGIFVATAALMIATGVQVLILWLKDRRVDQMYLITFVLVLVFGTVTLIFHNPLFLQWKVSIINWLFALVFLGSHFTQKTLFEHFIKNQDALNNVPLTVWRKLNAAWGIFFLMMGFLNLYVAYHYSTAIWVNFKVFGILGLTFVFVVLQALYLYRQGHR